MIKYLILFLGFLAVLLILIQISNSKSQVLDNNQIPYYKIVNTLVPTPAIKPKNQTINDFPFIVQAPMEEWENSVFQDGCEEASVLMVRCAINRDQCPMTDGVIDKEWAREQMVKMSEWQVEKYGGSTDTSAEDTAARLLNQYFGIKAYSVQRLASNEDLKNGVWIVPMDGRKLGNPFYTAPGPERHMIVVIGYDNKTDELITNDAGTRRGKNYRYKLDVFWDAIRDYPTGNHEPITNTEKKAIWVMGREGEWI